MDTFTRYVPGERNSIEFESNFILHPHTLEVVSGTVCPVVRVTVLVLKNFPAIAYSLCRESVASAATERIAASVPC